MKSPSVAVLIASRNRPDLIQQSFGQFASDGYENKYCSVIECGTDRSLITDYPSIWYSDEDFLGKCFGHNVGLQILKLRQPYDYYIFCMNDVFIEKEQHFVRNLVEVMEANPDIGVLSPTETNTSYPGANPSGVGLRTVTTCDYLFLVIRGSLVERFGFLNPKFKYCWGAIHEYSYFTYGAGFRVVYYDDISYRHLGGSTYGQKNTATISRADYKRNAKNFAADYFIENYGEDWDSIFWSTASSQHKIEINTYAIHRKVWESL